MTNAAVAFFMAVFLSLNVVRPIGTRVQPRGNFERSLPAIIGEKQSSTATVTESIRNNPRNG